LDRLREPSGGSVDDERDDDALDEVCGDSDSVVSDSSAGLEAARPAVSKIARFGAAPSTRIRGTELSLGRADMDPFGCALTGTARDGRRVNLASRLEYHGEPGQILVSDSVADQLADDFLFSPSTIIDLKGKGPTSVQVLLGRKAGAVTTPEPAAETSATVS
jgi:hypothetical protein